VASQRPGTRTSAHPIEVFIGWSLAICLHPSGAWRSSRRHRAVLVCGYVILGFVGVLSVLHIVAA
jgi:hypothetical protein